MQVGCMTKFKKMNLLVEEIGLHRFMKLSPHVLYYLTIPLARLKFAGYDSGLCSYQHV
jgi:hypothetical protein